MDGPFVRRAKKAFTTNFPRAVWHSLASTQPYALRPPLAATHMDREQPQAVPRSTTLGAAGNLPFCGLRPTGVTPAPRKAAYNA
jgi:hypothetical protein